MEQVSTFSPRVFVRPTILTASHYWKSRKLAKFPSYINIHIHKSLLWLNLPQFVLPFSLSFIVTSFKCQMSYKIATGFVDLIDKCTKKNMSLCLRKGPMEGALIFMLYGAWPFIYILLVSWSSKYKVDCKENIQYAVRELSLFLSSSRWRISYFIVLFS